MEFIPLLEAPETHAEILRLRNQEGVRKHMHSAHEITESEHANWIRSLTSNVRHQVFVIKYQGSTIGLVSLNAINTAQRTADWAFYLGIERQGLGLGSRVEFWLLDYAFDEAGLEKLNCEVLATNPAVVKLHEKFGFAVEGVRRKNILKDDQRLDVVLLGITREEWQARRPAMLEIVSRR